MIFFLIVVILVILFLLCYVEFFVWVLKIGLLYLYIYLVLGEIWVFIIGWNFILENVFVSVLLGNEFSKFVNFVSGNWILDFMIENVVNWIVKGFWWFLDFIGFIIVILFVFLVVIGLWKLVLFMWFVILINFLVVLFIVLFGFYFMDMINWEIFEKFVLYGFDGIM